MGAALARLLGTGSSRNSTPQSSRAPSGYKGRSQQSPTTSTDIRQYTRSSSGEPTSVNLPEQPDYPQPAVARSEMGTEQYHKKARCEIYPRSKSIKRFEVPDKYVPWAVEFDGYEPPDYTAESLLKEPLPPWSDLDYRHKNGESPVDQALIPRWNGLDADAGGKKGITVDRRSHEGEYKLDPETQVPLNPRGRTGLRGRGQLGRWGPNHAADPIVTRWKVDEQGKHIYADGKRIAEFIAVQRRDNGEWALPGGMVDPGENISATLKREFGEEALNSLQATEEEKEKIESAVNETFQRGTEVYRGYVDDPRNTDNAWMETVAMSFHDEDGTGVAKFRLHAGDDAQGVQWMELSHTLDLYADHIKFLKKTAEMLGASW